MIDFAISMVFGLTLGVIMCLVLWLNAKFTPTEFVMIIGFVFVSSTVWSVTNGTYNDFSLFALLVVWTLARILIDKWRFFEKILTFAMSTTIVLNYYIYLTFIDIRVGAVGVNTLLYMLTYLVIIGAIFFVLWFQKISFFSNKWVRDFFYHEDPNVKLHRMIIFSAVMFLTLIIVAGIYLSLDVISKIENAIIYIGFEFFFTFIYIFVSFAMLKIIVEYSILSDVTEQEKQHQAELQSFIKMIRAQRHDFNLHLHAVYGLLESEKYSECKEYVSKMVQDSAYINEIMPIFDTSISAMMQAYRSEAESMGISMKFDITNNLKGVALEPYEINRIIGNLLQNAIEAVGESKERDYGIVVRIYESNGGSVIDVANKFFGDISELAHVFEYSYSGKKGHDGVGLSTVQRIAESYKGMAYVEMDEDIVHFIVRLPKKGSK